MDRKICFLDQKNMSDVILEVKYVPFKMDKILYPSVLICAKIELVIVSILIESYILACF